jgi:LemA protein
MTVWYILAGIVVLAILWLIGTYNGLVQLRNRTDEAWSDIDVQAKRRNTTSAASADEKT